MRYPPLERTNRVVEVDRFAGSFAAASPWLPSRGPFCGSWRTQDQCFASRTRFFGLLPPLFFESRMVKPSRTSVLHCVVFARKYTGIPSWGSENDLQETARLRDKTVFFVPPSTVPPVRVGTEALRCFVPTWRRSQHQSKNNVSRNGTLAPRLKASIGSCQHIFTYRGIQHFVHIRISSCNS